MKVLVWVGLELMVLSPIPVCSLHQKTLFYGFTFSIKIVYIINFKRYRPAKIRSVEVLYMPPTRASMGISDELRFIRTLQTTRLALRHHVDVNDIKRVAKLSMELDMAGKAAANEQAIRSERMADYTALYHKVK